MHLLPTEEQNEIVDGVARFLEARMPFERLYGGREALRRDGSEIWGEGSQAGWFNLALPADQGGVGYSAVEEMLLQRELSRALAPLSMLATPLAARLALSARDESLAAALSSGQRRAGFAIRLSDHLLFLEGDRCDIALTIKGNRMDLREFGSSAKREPGECLDPTLSAVTVPTGGRGVNTILTGYDDGVLWHARLLIAAHLTALAERARDLAVDYAKLRQQFGRPIGSFQSIKHRCADMAVLCEAAYTQACAAAAALRDGSPEAALHVAASYTVAARAGRKNCRDVAQIHGAIGMTEEHVAHLLIKRWHVLEALGAGAGLTETLLTV
jgi:alkylation response protein AidB-like acyl-CoA dehydrogenase